MHLFISLNSKNESNAIKAVDKLTDQTELARVARDSWSEKVRMKAVEKLTDRDTLLNIAKKDKVATIREIAINVLIEQEVINQEELVLFVEDFDYWETCEYAINKLTDQELLINIAKTDSDYSMRELAIKRITDNEALLEIAKTDSDYSMRELAINEITDQSIETQEALSIIAMQDDWDTVRITAAKKINDQDLLENIANNSKCVITRLNAADKLTNQTLAQEIYYDIAKNNEEWDHFSEDYNELATKRLTDQVLLADIALNNYGGREREIAISKLTDQETLAKIIAKGKAMGSPMYIGDYEDDLAYMALDRSMQLKRQHMTTLSANTVNIPLQLINGHIFVLLDEKLWMINTGARTSFGDDRNLVLCGEKFDINSNYHGYSTDTISQYIDAPCAGLIGADILNRFDIIFDIPSGKLTISKGELPCDGQNLKLDEFMGIPIITVHIDNKECQMVFDTGAQISCFLDDSLTKYPSAGTLMDFNFMVGYYKTKTYTVPISLGSTTYTLRCGGTLPDSISKMFTIPLIKGIVGNEILKSCVVGYFLRHRYTISIK